MAFNHLLKAFHHRFNILLAFRPRFWKVWRGFEVQHGNEDTFRDMLRVKRSVQAMFSQVRMPKLVVNAIPRSLEVY